MLLALTLLSTSFLLAGVEAQTAGTCSPAAQFFDQRVDHSGHSTRTFKHKYQANAQFFRAGGPLLVIQGGEAGTMLCTEQMEIFNWAQEMNGALLSVEHRYFGESLPFGNDSYTNENLRHLTLDNIMSDTISLVDWYKKTINATDSKVIVVGGSYSGFLSMVLRINHPETFYGAISAAGPARAFLPFTDSNTERFNRYTLASNTWVEQSPEAASIVQQGFKQLASLVDSGKSDKIKDVFPLCNTPSKSERDDFLRNIAGIYGILLESNAAYLNPLFNTTGTPLETAINRTIAASSPLAALNETTAILCASQLATQGCWKWETQCTDGIGVQFTPWDYIRCNHQNFGMDVTPGTIFAPTLRPFDSTPHCRDTFNVTPPTRDELIAKYHFSEKDIRKTTRVIYSEAGWDPVRGFSVAPEWFPITPDTNAPRYMFIDGASHTQDTIRTMPGDSPALVNARLVQRNVVRTWLAQ
ncbi:hypothetical protein EXIGLDRAFT_834749 [Exidia glandulosa HHB12029]|uniref:Peptidase S28 n=1 Tax=Exidia glandulosa HHB12029 TaxID=1314781 RepID=A0A165JFT2_EXIGL|nr:hypothetical protein EXIGLDRAFT_834749 [Exidia glandulosa HHB12029]